MRNVFLAVLLVAASGIALAEHTTTIIRLKPGQIATVRKKEARIAATALAAHEAERVFAVERDGFTTLLWNVILQIPIANGKIDCTEDLRTIIVNVDGLPMAAIPLHQFTTDLLGYHRKDLQAAEVTASRARTREASARESLRSYIRFLAGLDNDPEYPFSDKRQAVLSADKTFIAVTEER